MIGSDQRQKGSTSRLDLVSLTFNHLSARQKAKLRALLPP
jgi:hypothetical protein